MSSRPALDIVRLSNNQNSGGNSQASMELPTADVPRWWHGDSQESGDRSCVSYMALWSQCDLYVLCRVGRSILEDGSKHRQTFTEAQAGLLDVSITTASKHKKPVCGLEQP